MYSGIYKIINIITDDIYIGSAVNFKNRFNRHKRDLFKNIHANNYLQNAVNKYGIDNFKFEILATCPKEYCIKLEQWFINSLKPKYNISPTAGSTFGCRFPKRSNLSEVETINILNDYIKLSIIDISKKYNIKESIVRSLIYKKEIAKDIKNSINFKISSIRKPINGSNNKQQRFSKEEIEKIAELYNNGVQPKYIAIQLFNDETLRYAITKIAKGISYKNYSYLFNKNISYYGKQNKK